MIMRGWQPTYSGPYAGGGAGCAFTGPWVGQPVRKRRGLGDCMSNADIQAAVGEPSDCGPRDVNCVMCNAQKSVAFQNLLGQCIATGTPISFTCDMSAAAMNTFMTNTPFDVNATVGTMQQPATADTTAVSTAQQQATLGRPAAASAPSAPAGPRPTHPPPSANPLPPAPAQPTVVNPSPQTQVTYSLTPAASSTSAVSQANGTTTSASGNLLSTVAGYVNQYPDIISGISNSALLTIVGVGAAALLVMAASQGGTRR